MKGGVRDAGLTGWQAACRLGTRGAEAVCAGQAAGPAGGPPGMASVAAAGAGAAAMEAELASEAGSPRWLSTRLCGGAGLREAGETMLCPSNNHGQAVGGGGVGGEGVGWPDGSYPLSRQDRKCFPMAHPVPDTP